MNALPTELLLVVACFADNRSLYALLLVSKRFNFAASRVLWYSLRLHSSRAVQSVVDTLQNDVSTYNYASFIRHLHLTLHRQASGCTLRDNIIRLFHLLSSSPLVGVHFGVSPQLPSPLKPIIDSHTMRAILLTKVCCRIKVLRCCDLVCFHEGMSVFLWLASRCPLLKVVHLHPTATKDFERVRQYFPFLT